MPPSPAPPQWTRRRALQALAPLVAAGPSLASGPPVGGRRLVVGPGERWRTLGEAAKAAQPGDTIEMQPGDYRADVAVLEQRPLTLRGLGSGAVLRADGRDAEGKAIVVVRGDVTIENVEFSGCRVPGGNGAGIRFEAGRLRLLRCRFFDNEMGLLSAGRPDMALDVVDCEFGLAPRHPGPLHHLLYVGAIGQLQVSGSRFEQGWRGHLLKSRARVNVVRGNWLVDGPLGEASYELEFPEGGDNVVAGNVIAQSAHSANPQIVSMGAEATREQTGRLVLLHNTIVNRGNAQAVFVRLWTERLADTAGAWMANNVIAGPGHFAPVPAQDGGGNLRVELAELHDADGGDFRLRAGRNGPVAAVVAPPAGLPQPLAGLPQPLEFAAPVGSRPFPARAPRQPGALQAPG